MNHRSLVPGGGRNNCRSQPSFWALHCNTGLSFACHRCGKELYSSLAVKQPFHTRQRSLPPCAVHGLLDAIFFRLHGHCPRCRTPHPTSAHRPIATGTQLYSLQVGLCSWGWQAYSYSARLCWDPVMTRGTSMHIQSNYRSMPC